MLETVLENYSNAYDLNYVSMIY
ncbi:MAG: hypothetical protein NKF70_09625 [Methanobacterium sp. ERen5]|nr:MAG: hypothetical protein NKF70_09625 [Methanobacterium sp. ERen5]